MNIEDSASRMNDSDIQNSADSQKDGDSAVIEDDRHESRPSDQPSAQNEGAHQEDAPAEEASTPNRDSRRLVQKARSGSDDAIEKLINECRDYLLLVANQELDKPLHAKVAPSDIVQETLYRAHARFDQFQGNSEREFLAWVRRILLNQVVNARRDLHRGKRDVAREQPLAGNSRRDIPAIDVSSNDPTPSRQVSNKESTNQLLVAMQRLPDDYREAVMLRNWQRLSFAEIGEKLDRSEDAARKLWYRAIDKLQSVLDELDPPT